MAKQIAVSKAVVEVEIPFTVMRRTGNERYEVVTGTVKGIPSNVKVIESGVSLVVGRDATTKSMRKQVNDALKTVGASIDV